MRTPFAETLIAFADSLEPTPGIVVERVSLSIPIEGRVDPAPGGAVFHATLPHTRWQSGILPPVGLAHLDFALAGEGE